jgi:hypothetical protein
MRIWNDILPWFGHQDIDTSLWENEVYVQDWWIKMATSHGNASQRYGLLALFLGKFEKSEMQESSVSMFLQPP